MSKYANRLIEHINTHPEFIQPVSRKNEMMNNFLLPGLQDLCVSRTSFKWGIPVDFDDKHVVYVWLDALTNYITGIGYDADGNSSEQYKKFWPADLHLIGKDIIRFHTIYWPIFLMALGEPLPKQVFGHPWLLQNDGKMSKSKGNVIYADDLVDMFGVDAVRYFVLHEMPFENDGVISWELLVERMNSDLANTLGNLVNRTIAMSNKYFGGVVNKTGVTSEGAGVDENGASLDFDADLKAVVTATRDKVQDKMSTLHVADAMTEVFSLFKRCNKYIDETIEAAEGFNEQDDKFRYIRNRLTWKRLFSVIVTDMNSIRINLYKRERIKDQSRYLRYEEAVGSTGQSQGIYIQFLIAIINYISNINAVSDGSITGNTIFIDNPFGAAKDIYIWEPIFKLLSVNHIQLIVPARGATPAITARFDVNYILGQKLSDNRQQTVVVDYYSSVKEQELEYTRMDYEQASFDFISPKQQ